MDRYLRQAMFRGAFMCANARAECRGIPFDPIFHQVVEHWDRIREQLAADINVDFHVYEGDEFREHLFGQYLQREGLTWPRLDTGRLDLKEKTFRDMAKLNPCLAPLHELWTTLSKLREIRIKVDADGRARTKLWAFGSKTGRTQPSATEYPFGPATWVRFFIKPQPGRAIAYCDYEQQEFGIAACLSGDAKMIAAYNSGDPTSHSRNRPAPSRERRLRPMRTTSSLAEKSPRRPSTRNRCAGRTSKPRSLFSTAWASSRWRSGSGCRA
jgi:DNA polymerase-1